LLFLCPCYFLVLLLMLDDLGKVEFMVMSHILNSLLDLALICVHFALPWFLKDLIKFFWFFQLFKSLLLFDKVSLSLLLPFGYLISDFIPVLFSLLWLLLFYTLFHLKVFLSVFLYLLIVKFLFLFYNLNKLLLIFYYFTNFLFILFCKLWSKHSVCTVVIIKRYFAMI